MGIRYIKEEQNSTEKTEANKKEFFEKRVMRKRKFFNESNQKRKYKAHMFGDVYEDDYNEGEGANVNSWDIELTANSIDRLISDIEDNIGVDRSDMYFENINDYDWASEIWADSLTDDRNIAANKRDIEAWKKGNKVLYSTRIQILVSIVGESPVPESEIRSAGIKG